MSVGHTIANMEGAWENEPREYVRGAANNKSLGREERGDSRMRACLLVILFCLSGGGAFGPAGGGERSVFERGEIRCLTREFLDLLPRPFGSASSSACTSVKVKLALSIVKGGRISGIANLFPRQYFSQKGFLREVWFFAGVS